MTNPFESQSIQVIQRLMDKKHMTRELAMKTWFNSQTYKEILKQKLTYISAMRAFYELELEETNNPDWMRNAFDI